jgi:hypothetical protein
MAQLQSDQREAGQEHQAGQAALVGGLADLVAQAWQQVVDPHDLKGTLPKFKILVLALTRRFGSASSAAAMAYYRQQRRAAGIPGTPKMAPASPVSPEQISKSIDWAVKDVWAAAPAPGSGVVATTEAPVADVISTAIDRAAAAAEQAALDQGRQSLIDTVAVDKKARGWARVPEPGACSFCLLLATRGVVYHTQESGGFQAHDNCRCHVEPLFGPSYEPTAQVRAAQAIYATSTRGHKNAAARNAFRKAVATARADGHPYL